MRIGNFSFNKRALSIIFLIIITISWGISFVSIKVIMDFSGPSYTAFFRYLLSAAITGIIAKKTGGIEKLQKKDIPRMVGTSLVGVTLYFYCENTGILYTSPGAASVIIALTPLATMVLHRLISKEKISMRNALCVGISVIGVYLIIGGSANLAGSWKGYAYMGGAMLSWALFLVWTKPLFQTYSNMTVTMYQSIFGLIGFIPLLTGDYIHPDKLNGTIIANYLFLALICTAFCGYCYNYALNYGGIHMASIFLNGIPVVTLISSYFLLGEKINFLQGIGVVITLVCISLIKQQRERVEDKDGIVA